MTDRRREKGRPPTASQVEALLGWDGTERRNVAPTGPGAIYGASTTALSGAVFFESPPKGNAGIYAERQKSNAAPQTGPEASTSPSQEGREAGPASAAPNVATAAPVFSTEDSISSESLGAQSAAAPFPPTGLEPPGCPTPGACSCPSAITIDELPNDHAAALYSLGRNAITKKPEMVLQGSIIDCADQNTWVERSAYDALAARLAESEGRAEDNLNAFKKEFKIVDRIWDQLGRPSYEELKGRSIHDLIDELKAALKESERLKALALDHIDKDTAEIERLHKAVDEAERKGLLRAAEICRERAAVHYSHKQASAGSALGAAATAIKRAAEEGKG